MRCCGQHSSAKRDTGAGANSYCKPERSPGHKKLLTAFTDPGQVESPQN